MSPNYPPTYLRMVIFTAIGLIATSSAVRAERPASPLLLPDTTVAMVSIVDVPEAIEKFMNTAYGRMSRDPQLKPLVADLYKALEEAAADMEKRFGLSLDRLRMIPQGEVTVAVVAREGSGPTPVILCDVGDRLADARTVIDALGTELEGQGAKRTENTVGRTKLVYYTGVAGANRKAAYFERDATVVASTDPELLRQIIAAWDGDEKDTLSRNSDFATIMRRCRVGGNQRPHLAGYIDPIAIVRAQSQTNTAMQIGMAMLPLLGLDGLSAAGGTITFDTESYDMVTHAHVLLETPRSGIPKAIALGSGNMEPESWVPDDAVSYTTLHWKVQQSYETLTAVYDSIQGEGALKTMLERRISRTTGIDFEKEILGLLEGRVSFASWIQRPVTAQSQATIVGLKLLDADEMEKTLQRMGKEKQDWVEEQTYAAKTYYRVRTPQMPEGYDGPPMPVPCFGVLDDYLLMANNPALYEKAIATARGPKSLADQLDFKLVAQLIRRQPGGARPAMISFKRPDESMRYLYDMATNKNALEVLARQAVRSRAFRAVDTALKTNPLPPFEVFRQYLAPTGALLFDDGTGIHYTGFTLRRK